MMEIGNKNWYILQVISGKEKMAVTNLEALSKRYTSLEEENNFIKSIRVPEEEVRQIKNGKRKTVKQKMLPGYILIELSLPLDAIEARRICSDIVNTHGVASFVGTKDGMPLPVAEDELEVLFEKMGETPSKAKGLSARVVVMDFQVGDQVRVIEGPFKDSLGQVDHIDMERKKIRVRIDIFGSPTPVELEAIQVDKI